MIFYDCTHNDMYKPGMAVVWNKLVGLPGSGENFTCVSASKYRAKITGQIQLKSLELYGELISFICLNSALT